MGPWMERVSNPRKLEVEGASRGCSFLKLRRNWPHSNIQSRAQPIISKVLRQRDLYHNPDPLGQANESKVIVEGQETQVLLDSGSQLSAISWTWVKRLKLEPKQLQSILWIEGSGGLKVPYLGYVEVCLEIPEVKAFNQDVLLLIVPNNTHT